MRDISVVSESAEERRKIGRAKKTLEVFKEMADSGDSFSAVCKRKKVIPTIIDEVLPADCLFSEALKQIGLSDTYMAKQLKKLLKAKAIKIDKNGEVHETEDNSTRLKALELWVKVTGALSPTKSENKSLKINADMSDKELDSLLGKANEGSEVREVKKVSKD